MQRQCYPCDHVPLHEIQHQFSDAVMNAGPERRRGAVPPHAAGSAPQENRRDQGGTLGLQRTVRRPELHVFTVIRNPVARILSEYFFLQPVCAADPPDEDGRRRVGALRSWVRQSYTPMFQHALCSGDFERFATDPRSDAVNQQTRLLATGRIESSMPAGAWAAVVMAAPHAEAALRSLRQFDLVLVQEHTSPIGHALLNHSFGGDFSLAAFRKMATEHGFGADGDYVASSVAEPIVLTGNRTWLCQRTYRCRHHARRALLEKNQTLMHLVAKANQHDVAVHTEATRLFRGKVKAVLGLAFRSVPGQR